MLLGLAGIAVLESSLLGDRGRLAQRISVQRRNVEPLTSIRRDTRKTYVALLELWLASEEDQARLASRLDSQVTALMGSSKGFLEGRALTSAEQQHRMRLLANLGAWAAFIDRIRTQNTAREARREARRRLEEIDQQCSEILKDNVEGADRDDIAREAVKQNDSWVRACFGALVAMLLAYVVMWYLKATAARRLADSLRQQKQKDEQNLALEGLVQRRTAELGKSHARLSESTAQLMVAKEELERRVHELATTQNQLVQAEKLQAVGQLAAGIAHEINTPSQFIGDSLHFLKEAFVGYKKLIGQYRRAVEALAVEASGAGLVLVSELQRIEEDVDLSYLEANVPTSFVACMEGILRITTIVEAMKEFAQPDQREKSPADLNHALQATLVVARNDYASVAEVTTEFGDLPPVLCHVGDLNQVFLNLIINAAHAIGEVMKTGGAMGTIRVKTSRDGDQARIDITDSGSGIPDAIRNRVFDPFFTTKEVGKGTGQGLAIARSVIVTKHGGTLTFESEVGKGTTFTIRLPIGVE
jgi:signal transduction histidine kinase